MFRFLETFSICNGRIQNPLFHIERIRGTIDHFYPDTPEPAWINYLEQSLIQNLITSTHPLQNETIYKGRLLWGNQYSPEPNSGLNCEPYIIRKLKHLYVFRPQMLPDYRFKYADRSIFKPLTDRAGIYGDIVILNEKDQITDTSFTNIVFSDGKRLVTPSRPLLCGTCRSRLLSEKVIQEDIITVKDIKYFRTIHLINALIPLGSLELPVNSIII